MLIIKKDIFEDSPFISNLKVTSNREPILWLKLWSLLSQNEEMKIARSFYY